MKKNIILYFLAAALIAVSFLFFNRAYREMLNLSDLTSRATIVYGSFQHLSKQINNAAVINPELIRAGRHLNEVSLFFTDSATVMQQLDLLKSSVRDSLNLQITGLLAEKVKQELPWLLKSNVPDSILKHKSPRHLAALQSIDSLIALGVKRTNFLFDHRKEELNRSLSRLRTRMYMSIFLFAILLIYMLVGLFWHKSKRIKKEQELQIKELQFNNTLDNMIEGIQIHDFSWKYIYVNDALVKYSTYLKEELLGHTLMEKYPGIEQSDLFKILQKCMTERVTEHIETEFVFPNGTQTFFELSIQPVPEGIFILSIDISERKKAEEKLLKANRLYKFLSNINKSIVQFNNKQELLDKACTIATEIGQFKLAYVGMLDEDNKLNIISIRGDEAGTKRILQYTGLDYNDPVHKDIPTVKVMKTGKYAFNNDMQNDPAMSRLKDEFISQGINASISLPIHSFGKIVGIFGLHSAIKDFFDAAEVALLDEAARDISFALENFEKEKKHKETEALVEQNERRFSAFIEFNSDMKTLTSAEGNFIYGSPSITKVFGYSTEEFLSKSAFNFFHPDDIPDLVKNRTSILETPGRSFNFQYRLLHKGGSWIWCEGTLANMFHEPAINALVSNFRDISDRKILEQTRAFDQNNLNALINNTRDLMWSIDRDFKLITFNQPFHEAIKTLTGKDLAKGDDILSAAYNQQQSINFRQLYLRAFNGEAFTETQHIEDPVESWLEISFCPIKNSDRVIGTACHSRDITERKKTEYEREKMISDIIQRNKNFEQFAYIVSHNLRAPVANILGLSNILKSDLSDADRHKTQQFLFQAVNNLDEIVKDLNKILQTRTEISEIKEPVSFSGLVTTIKAGIQNLIEKQNIQIVTDFSKIDQVTTLKSYIYSVFYNLVSNSIKYSQPGKEPVIHIRSDIQDGKIRISFKDNGRGIDLKLYGEKIFGLYQRFHMNVEGKGLGLFMVKTQLEVLGGNISVNSHLGSGTEFIIELPV